MLIRLIFLQKMVNKLWENVDVLLFVYFIRSSLCCIVFDISHLLYLLYLPEKIDSAISKILS